MKIQIYGREGDSSYGVVTAGWCEGLAANGVLFSLVTSENFGDHDLTNCDISLITDPHMLRIANCFEHRATYLIVAPHSHAIPDDLIESIIKHDITVLPPSNYCAQFLRAKLPNGRVIVVPHGVRDQFTPVDRDELFQTGTAKHLRGDGANFVHVAGASLARKGTSELIEAFANCLKLGLDGCLTLVLSGFDAVRASQRIPAEARKRIRIVPRLQPGASAMRWFYSCFDYVIQPSRVEGFGMSPLEALACDVPCVVTAGTGHMKWLEFAKEACVTIPLGTDGPLETEGDEQCPTVRVEDIEHALFFAVQNTVYLSEQAKKVGSIARQLFAWKAVVGRFLPQLQMERHDQPRKHEW